ncbi:MAG TPA: methyltransferase domain-containing protein [Thermoanaerobaculia bacterium]|nr:methyltransferase domain-containing protein [Thermoanaerobaculia bacterium]
MPRVSAFERRARQVRRVLRRFPVLQPLVNRVGTWVWRWHLSRKAQQDGGPALPTRIELDPASIERAVWRAEVLELAGSTQQRNAVGLVRGGDWDERSFPLSELAVFAAVRRRVEEGVAWEETAFHAEIEAALDRGERPFKFRTHDDLERIFAKVDRLHEEIARDGYRDQEELGTGRPWDEVVVAFDRHGRPLFVDGRHRLALARALGLDSIPAIVAVRHERWARLAGEVHAYAAERGGRAYQPYLHPDLAPIPSDQGHERFDLLLAALPIRSGTLLDLGANSGYFSHRFEAAGFDCVAVERSEKEAHFLTALRDASGRRFEILKGSLTEVPLPPRLDVVLALNIFHHFLKTEAGYRELSDFLGRLETRFMLFESHLPDDPQMRQAAVHLGPDEFAGRVADLAGMERVERIGKADDGRPIFLLERT